MYNDGSWGVGVLKRILRCMPEFMLKRKAGFDLTDVGRDAVFYPTHGGDDALVCCTVGKGECFVSGDARPFFDVCNVVCRVVFGGRCPTGYDFFDGVAPSRKIGCKDDKGGSVAVRHGREGFETFVVSVDFSLKAIGTVADV